MRAPNGDDNAVVERTGRRLKLLAVEIQYPEECGALVHLGPDTHRVCQETWCLSPYPLRIADGEELALTSHGITWQHLERSQNSKQTGRCMRHLTGLSDFTYIQQDAGDTAVGRPNI